MSLSFCFVSAQNAVARDDLAAPANLDPDRIRAIVEQMATKSDAKAVLFGMWRHDREMLTMALGESMTTVPASTDMHYRIGGIGETFMSTLLLMLVEQGRIGLDEKISRWFPELLGADQVAVRMLVSNTVGYIDYVTVPDFLRLQLEDPFRTFRFFWLRYLAGKPIISTKERGSDNPNHDVTDCGGYTPIFV